MCVDIGKLFVFSYLMLFPIWNSEKFMYTPTALFCKECLCLCYLIRWIILSIVIVTRIRCSSKNLNHLSEHKLSEQSDKQIKFRGNMNV